jgi:cell wall-associated NlpC family hydrolase
VLSKPLRTLIALVVTLIAVGATGTNAYAQPSIPEIEGQIQQQWNQLEPLIEQYNMVHTQLAQNQSRSAALAKQMQPMQLRVDLELTRVSAISIALYERGNSSKLNAILAAGSPTTLADQLSTLDHMARGQAATVQDAANTVAKYNAQKRPLDELIAVEARQDADLATKKSTIGTQMASLQKLRQAAYGANGSVGGRLKPVACPVEYTGGKGGIAARTACSEIGKPYVWATAGPRTFDCSGLTLYAWAAAGVTLGHFTGWQWNEGKPVSRADLQPGDLVFFFSDLHHMGMYVGGGWFIHAPTSGDVVRMGQLDSANLPIAGFRRPG